MRFLGCAAAAAATLLASPAWAGCYSSITNSSLTDWMVTADTTAGGGDVSFGPIICERALPDRPVAGPRLSARGPEVVSVTLDGGCGMQIFYSNSFFGFSHGWIRFDIPGRSPPVAQWYSYDNNGFFSCPSLNPGGTTPNMNLNEPLPGGAHIFGNG